MTRTMRIAAGVIAVLGLCAHVLAQIEPVDVQPLGVLSGKIVYVHAGHGLTANNDSDGSWEMQRPEFFEMIEDLGNQDGLTFLVDRLWRSGATVVPLRPVGYQPIEVVIDNDDTEVEYSGAWTAASASVFYGDAGDTPYRTAMTSATESAVARFRPDLPEAGFYPVYAWAAHGSDRVRQLYRVAHSGGFTEVWIDHRRVGSGLVYLGTFHFATGTAGYVAVSNQSDDTGIVVADMIRFGNGMGDIDRGGGISGATRGDEAGLYWVMWHVDRSQGIPESAYRASSLDRSATVSHSPRYSAYMNREATGTMTDRAFVSYHSNGGGGSARGVLALYNGNNNPATATPNQAAYASILGQEVNDDLVALTGTFEHAWHDRGTSISLDRSDIEFGEINNLYIGDEFDATIVETGFHDNQTDAEMIRDPRVRDALSRATLHGLVRYFSQFDGGVTPLWFPPARVTGLSARGTGIDGITLDWVVPDSGPAIGDAPWGYRIRASLDGRGFDGGVYVSGGETSSHTITGLDPGDGAHLFVISAVNGAGESMPSSVVAATPGAPGPSMLIVDGYDRFDRNLNPRQSILGMTIDRVRPRRSNAFDYAGVVAAAAQSAHPMLDLATAANERVIDGSMLLGDHAVVTWVLGLESTANQTLDATERALVTAYRGGGGALLISGAEIGWDLDQQGHAPAFYHDTLLADFVADDAGTYLAQGASGSIFETMNLTFDDGSVGYDVRFPDIIDPLGGATTAMTYVDGNGGGAAIQFTGDETSGKLVMLGFPFESIVGADDRAAVMTAMLDFVLLSCAADIDGTGTVGFSDLVIVLANWGTNGAGADIAEPLDVVGFEDLVGVLAAWGSCP